MNHENEERLDQIQDQILNIINNLDIEAKKALITKIAYDLGIIARDKER